MTTDLDTAHKVCTPNELAAYQLHYRRYSERRIALALNISRSAVQSRLENARRKIHAANQETAA
jgi:DNA-binding CsgD family transcriptional regulator